MGTTPATPAAYCRHCSYALAGLPDNHRCPECGHAFDLANPKTFRRRPRRGWWRIARWFVYPLLLLILAAGGGVGWTWWGWNREQPAIASAWAPRWGGLGGVRTKPIGPPWLRKRFGRWEYLLERADSLYAGSNSPVKPADLPLARLRHLDNLGLCGQGVGDELMAELERLSRLTTLTLVGTSVSDEGLARLRGCRALEMLVLNDTRVGQKGLAALADHPQLKRLYLYGTPVDDRSLPVLKRLTKLEVLDPGGTKLTPAAVAELKEALPNCRIYGP